MIVSYVFHANVIFSQCCASLDALMDGRSPGTEHDPQTPLSSLPAPVCRVKRYAGRGHRSFPISPPSDAGFPKSARDGRTD